MEFSGFYNYKRGSRGNIKHKTAAAMPAFYPWSPVIAPAAAVPAGAGAGISKARPAATPSPPPSAVTVVEAGMYNGGGHAGGGVEYADVDRRAAMYISRVQERLRRERMTSEDWRKYY
uniref:Uncharacterized protein n=1 Tax=Leersia perrieri TaxID=77586 RepID=A0A0D9W435_9ORYZ